MQPVKPKEKLLLDVKDRRKELKSCRVTETAREEAGYTDNPHLKNNSILTFQTVLFSLFGFILFIRREQTFLKQFLTRRNILIQGVHLLLCFFKDFEIYSGLWPLFWFPLCVSVCVRTWLHAWTAAPDMKLQRQHLQTKGSGTIFAKHPVFLLSLQFLPWQLHPRLLLSFSLDPFFWQIAFWNSMLIISAKIISITINSN